MAEYIRFQCVIDGFPGQTGVNTLAVSSPLAVPGAEDLKVLNELVEDAYSGMVQGVVQGVTFHAPETFEIRDVATNELLRVMPNEETPWSVTGTVQSSTSRATMAKIRFFTDGIRRNRGVQGGPYIGPLAGLAISPAGAILPSYISEVITAWSNFIDATPLGYRLGVYSQPAPAKGKWPAAEGQFSHVQRVGVMPIPAVLRSRRD